MTFLRFILEKQGHPSLSALECSQSYKMMGGKVPSSLASLVSFQRCSLSTIPPSLVSTSLRFLGYSLFPKFRKKFECPSYHTNLRRLSSSVDYKMSIRLSDYDCIGFDLDNTLCEYKVLPMVHMEYDVLSKFLVNQKGYSKEFLCEPLSVKDTDFFQRGLILDFERGNVLKLAEDGSVLKAYHGTRQLSHEEISHSYGDHRRNEDTLAYCKDMTIAWTSQMKSRYRVLLDSFDMPASLVFARAVDWIDSEGKHHDGYTVGRDVLAGLVSMFNRKNFPNGDGGYFKELKANPHKYYQKCSPEIIEWLKELKKTKPLFLITGSHVDYASFTASYCLGEDWKNLFDSFIFFAGKPGFFNARHPFFKVEGVEEVGPISASDLKKGEIYSQGNWGDFYTFLSHLTNKPSPKCLYFGDNLVQDVFTPSFYNCCDAAAVVEELDAEFSTGHPSERCLKSSCWGSYFFDSETGVYTLWGHVVKNHAKICVPSLNALVKEGSVYKDLSPLDPICLSQQKNEPVQSYEQATAS